VLKCQAGCTGQQVVTAMDLEFRDLFPSGPGPARNVPPRASRRRAGSPPRGQVVAVYDYRDEAHTLLFQVVRYTPKGFAQRRPVDDRYAYNMNGVRRVLYRLDELLSADPAQIVFLTEGERDTDALVRLGLVATTNLGGAGKWRPEYSEALRGRVVIILPDNDSAGRAHARQVAAALVGIAAHVHVLELPNLPEKGDVSDWLAAGGTRAQLEALAAEPAPPAPATPAAAPAPPPVPLLQDLLDDVEAFLRAYVVFPSRAAAVATTLWVTHTYVIETAEVTPYLAILSPEKRCGKSRLLEVLEVLVPRAWLVGRPSEAALFRMLSEEPPPTLLFDEVDTVFKAKAGDPVADGIRAVLNMGYRQGATVPRCVPPSQKVQRFAVFGAKALAGIGALPDTVLDRSVPIRLRRKRKTEQVKRWRRREVLPAAEPLCARLAAWADAQRSVLAETVIEAPETLNDRAGEIWEPLLAIAHMAGSRWLEDARAAAQTLHEAEADDESAGVRLLAAIAAIFAERDQGHLFTADRILTADLLRALVDRVEEPWAVEWGRDVAAAPEDQAPRGPAARLATLLRPFGIQSRPLRDGDRKGKGYFRADFADAFARYLPSPDVENGTTGQSAPDADLRAVGERDTPPAVPFSDDAETLAAHGLSRCPDFQTQDGVDNGEDEEVIA
jgi:5S rRNA maturation endonuclease (ribonuclease M5)